MPRPWLVIVAAAALLSPLAGAQTPLPGGISHWEQVGVGLEDAHVTRIAVDKNGVMFAGLSDYGTLGVFSLAPDSPAWKATTAGLRPEGAVVVLPGPDGGIIAQQGLTTADGGAFRGLVATSSPAGWISIKEHRPGEVWPFVVGGAFNAPVGTFVLSGASRYLEEELFLFGTKGGSKSVAMVPLSLVAVTFNFGPSGSMYGADFCYLARSEPGAINMTADIKFVSIKGPLGDKGCSKSAEYTSIAEGPGGAVYVAVGPRDLNATARVSGVFRMSATRATWTDITTNLPDSYWYSLGTDASGNIFAAAYGEGVWVLPPQATQWLPVNTGLTGGALTISQLQFINGVPYLSTDAGVFVGRK